jgi:hypothetical protein
VTLAVLNDAVGGRDGAPGLGGRVEVARGAFRVGVRVSGTDVMALEFLGLLDRIIGRSRRAGQRGQELADRVSARLAAQRLEQRLDRLLRGLLGRERRPLVHAVLQRVAGVGQVAEGLSHPVVGARCHAFMVAPGSSWRQPGHPFGGRTAGAR